MVGCGIKELWLEVREFAHVERQDVGYFKN